MPAVAVYVLRGKARSREIATALADGVAALGLPASVQHDGEYRCPDAPVAAFYGYQQTMPRIFRDYVESGRRVVFVDLGYWGRREGGIYKGYHKVAVNARHPTAYFRRGHDSSRVRRFRLEMQPWRRGRKIVVAGMSGKAAQAIGLRAEEWERAAIAELRRHTDRPIVYRPKPTWENARPLPGAEYSGPRDPLAGLFADAWAVVTHHSNVAVDGLVSGVPAFCWEGVAAPMGLQDLSRIETPHYPDDREQWAADVAYCQWSVAEIASGAMWRHLMNEGLV